MRDLLAGRRDDVYNFFGNTARPEKLTNKHLHGLYLREKDGWLTVLVHLFASAHGAVGDARPYEIVVGKLK
jgi:hypothetical protein